jgi:hypothetical protein
MCDQTPGFSFGSVAKCMAVCEAIETSFEALMPELFEKYFADRLHGRNHALSVLRWSMHVSDVVLDSTNILADEIDHPNLIAAALLHDTAGLAIMDAGRAEHHTRAADYIRPILEKVQERGHEPLDAGRVCTIARAHRLRADTPPKTVSEEIIALADGLDESMTRLYRGNSGRRPFYDATLSMDHRLRVAMRRNMAHEGIDREDPRNDTLMFMLDSLVRNSVDYNPWKLVLSATDRHLLRIPDDSWQIISTEYFHANYAWLIHYVRHEAMPSVISLVDAFLAELSQCEGFRFICRLRDDLIE